MIIDQVFIFFNRITILRTRRTWIATFRENLKLAELQKRKLRTTKKSRTSCSKRSSQPQSFSSPSRSSASAPSSRKLRAPPRGFPLVRMSPSGGRRSESSSSGWGKIRKKFFPEKRFSGTQWVERFGSTSLKSTIALSSTSRWTKFQVKCYSNCCSSSTSYVHSGLVFSAVEFLSELSLAVGTTFLNPGILLDNEFADINPF